jgi:hypothetical protein
MMANALKRKMDSFLQDPSGSLLWYARTFGNKTGGLLYGDSSWIRKQLRLALRSWSRYQLNRYGCLNLLASRPPNAYPPDCTDLWFLYRQVRQRKPRCVLEFGSGCSTVILAQALWENRRDNPKDGGFLYSVDADAYWADVTVKTMPGHLRDVCDVRHSELVEVEYAGTPGYRHAEVPDVAPDFLYLDGPDFTPGRQVAVDVVDLEPRFPAHFFMVVDGRWTNCKFLNRHLKEKYAWKPRWPLERWRTSTFERIL